MQKRLVRKLDLERFLSQVEHHPTPKPNIEQYTIPTGVAATMLHIAAYVNDDVIHKTVLDLGCGTGRIALGAAFLGAEHVVGVDIDRTAVKKAFENLVKTGLGEKVQWVCADIKAVCGRFDTVMQNPPFGVQTRGADRAFLEKALETGRSVYSLHKSLQKNRAFIERLKTGAEGVLPVDPSPFLKEFIESRGGRVRAVYAMVMTVPHMFSFHTKRRHEFVVDLYVLEGRH
jgi:putative methylase